MEIVYIECVECFRRFKTAQDFVKHDCKGHWARIKREDRGKRP